MKPIWYIVSPGALQTVGVALTLIQANGCSTVDTSAMFSTQL